MQPTQLDLLPQEQAALLLRKKRFWKKTMWISLAATLLLVVVGFSGTIIGMVRAFATLEKSGAADPAVLAQDISRTLIVSMVAVPLIALAALLFLVSLIRCLSLPKLPASPHME